MSEVELPPSPLHKNCLDESTERILSVPRQSMPLRQGFGLSTEVCGLIARSLLVARASGLATARARRLHHHADLHA